MNKNKIWLGLLLMAISVFLMVSAGTSYGNIIISRSVLGGLVWVSGLLIIANEIK